jgi:uncharacterized protein YkwD
MPPEFPPVTGAQVVAPDADPLGMTISPTPAVRGARLQRRTALASLVLLATVLATLVPAPPADAARLRTGQEQAIESRLFDRHNVARSDPGAFGYASLGTRSPFRWAEDMAEVARAWSDEMARTGNFRHNPNFSTQVKHWTLVGENIAVVSVSGRTDRQIADVMMQLWMDSQGHRTNIMNPRFTQVGIGVSGASNGRVYATVLFREPTSSAPRGSTSYPESGATTESTTSSTPVAQCHALVGDWNGSGRDGIGWWCNGRTRLRHANGTITNFTYGRTGDVPVVADWNGNGRDTVSVIRDGTWHVNNQLTGGTADRTFTYGRVSRGDTPIAGDWTRTGRSLPGIIRDREWHLRHTQSGGPSDHTFTYGRLTAGDLPLWGDWNGDRRTTPGIVRNGEWHLRNSLSGGTAHLRYTYGRVLAGDIPVTGDWTGNGIDTPAIVRDTTWYLKYTHSGGTADRTITLGTP